MTRHIMLPLAEDTTATECGACRSCGRFVYAPDGPMRTPDCLAAERQAERMVEIAPEDAAYFGTLLRGFAIYTGDPDRLRVFAESLREHARKAKR